MGNKAKNPPADAEQKTKALDQWNDEGGAPASGDRSNRKRPKRPRDPNQLGKLIVDLSVGEVHEVPIPEDTPASQFARTGGLKGGPARAGKLSPERRAEIAKKAAETRWRKP